MNSLYKFADSLHTLMYKRQILNVLIPKSLLQYLENADCSDKQFIRALEKCSIKPILLSNERSEITSDQILFWDGVRAPTLSNSLFISNSQIFDYDPYILISNEHCMINQEKFDCGITCLKDLLFCLLGCRNQEKEAFLPFGPIPLPMFQVFYMSTYCYCTVNLKPFVPGHVMVLCRRPVPSLDMLSDEELSDMMITVKRVSHMIKTRYGSEALTIAIQDGKAAGQTIPHVHIHIMPRKENDFEKNDDVYNLLDQMDYKQNAIKLLPAVPDCDRKPRNRDELTQEASEYAILMTQ